MTVPLVRKEGDIVSKMAAAKAASAAKSAANDPLAAIATPPAERPKPPGIFGASGFTSFIQDLACPVGKVPNLLTSLPIFDRVADQDGIAHSQLVVIAGRPGGGKTAAKEQVERFVAASGKSVLSVSLEMTERQCQSRHLAALSGVSARKINSYELTPAEVFAVENAAKDHAQVLDNICLVKWSDDVLKTIDEHIAAFGVPALITLDYLQIALDPYAGSPEHVALSQLCRRLVHVAETHKTVVLALSQLGRDHLRSGRSASLADLAGGDGIATSAAIVALLEQVPSKSAGCSSETFDVEFTLAKNRPGQQGLRDRMSVHGPTLTFGPSVATNKPPLGGILD